jgi:hypothetical protein
MPSLGADGPVVELDTLLIESFEGLVQQLTDLDRLFAVYSAAKTKYDAAINALNEASRAGGAPDRQLMHRQAAAAMEEFDALVALRGISAWPTTYRRWNRPEIHQSDNDGSE